MGARDRLFPLDLPRPNFKALAFASLAVFDAQKITADDYCDTTKRIAMPRHSLTRSKAQTAYDCGSVLKHNFIRHFNSRGPCPAPYSADDHQLGFMIPLFRSGKCVAELRIRHR